MATGLKVNGREQPPLHVALWNLEDPMHELDRVYIATCNSLGVEEDVVRKNLFLNSGRDVELCIAEMSRVGLRLHDDTRNNLVDAIKAQKIDVLIVDPFVSSHRVPENDNGAMDGVVKYWAKIAGDANCAIELVHHTRKEGGKGTTAESARGGSAIISAARDVRVINILEENKAGDFGIDKSEANRYIQVRSDKANFAPIGAGTWYKIKNVPLLNDSDQMGGDGVGVVEPYDMRRLVIEVDEDQEKDALQLLVDNPRRHHYSSPDWAGYTIAKALGIKLDMNTGKECIGRKRIAQVLQDWLSKGYVCKEEQKLSNGVNKPHFVITKEGIAFSSPPLQQG